MFQYENGHIERGRHVKGRVPPTTLIDIADRYPGLQRSIQLTQGVRRLCSSKSAPAFLHYQFAQRDAELADRFFTALESGANLSTDDPIYHLRERLLQMRSNSQKRANETFVMAVMIKAWNVYRTGGKMTQLRWRIDERFPEIR